jgi:hypothetical protein
VAEVVDVAAVLKVELLSLVDLGCEVATVVLAYYHGRCARS